MTIVQFVTMFLFMLVAGVFWGTWFSLSRSITSITPATANLAGPMSLLIPFTIVATLVLVVVLHRRHDKPSFELACAALALLAVSTAITLAVNVPIDDQISGWTRTLPANWDQIRNRWEFYHGLRTALTVIGGGCLFASAWWTHSQHGGGIEGRV